MDEPTAAPDMREAAISKFPALLLLRNLGWKYLSPEEAVELRGGRLSNVVLEGVLAPWLREHNRVRLRDREAPFSEGNILAALQALREMPTGGLVRANETVYELVCLGKSLQQAVDGDVKSFTLQYVDWNHPEENVFHVTEEFRVERSGSRLTYAPDLVLFVNGIPFCVIECKAPSLKDPMGEAISQHLRNQKEGGIPRLFHTAQLLLAISKNEARYGTVGTAAKFWSVWRERSEGFEERVREAVSTPLSEEDVDRLMASPALRIREDSTPYATIARKPTEQDRALCALCSPERLLELAYRFVLFESGERKIARYQQYFCVQKIMDRITSRDKEGRRRGGVVWHTQGSGKSLTMVLLAKAIALSSITNYRIVLVTDRVELDKQLYETFRHCGREVERAGTGKSLISMLRGSRQRIISTVIDKFEAAVGQRDARNDSPDIFVLVDEGHRSQYGPRHARMRRVLPNACYIGFTGTPVMKKDRDTVERFGGLIDAYTIDQAVQDQAVAPLLYEGRHVEQYVDAGGIDRWFDRVTASLSKEQAADLKKKFSSTEQLSRSAQRVRAIAYDVGLHFRSTWQGTGFKAQLVTPKKATALLYKKYLDEFGAVSSEVLISAPDDREGEEDLYAENREPVVPFWKTVLQKYGSERAYNEQVVNAFKKADDPEIIIVVDKLLTGFDAPRNTVLYLARKLEDHTLLQAIARVNRLHDGKEFGFVIDYQGVLDNLDHALDLYGNLPGFEPSDIQNTLTDVRREFARLPQLHSVLWDTFKELSNRNDEEEYEVLLADPEKRSLFHERLSAFARCLGICLSSAQFLEETPESRVRTYREDLKFFTKLRTSVRRRYAETVDFSEYEPRIQKLLDTHVGSGEVERMTPLVNIFDKEAFQREVAKVTGAAAKADTIAHRTARTIHERMQEDPAFYRRFSEMLEDAIRAFREGRLKANGYLKRVTEIMNSVRDRTGSDVPGVLKDRDVARAYYGCIRESLKENVGTAGSSEAGIAELALSIDDAVERHRVVDWVNDEDVQNTMRNHIEDSLFEFKEKMEIELGFDEIDAVMEQCLDIARVRRP